MFWLVAGSGILRIVRIVRQGFGKAGRPDTGVYAETCWFLGSRLRQPVHGSRTYHPHQSRPSSRRRIAHRWGCLGGRRPFEYCKRWAPSTSLWRRVQLQACPACLSMARVRRQRRGQWQPTVAAEVMGRNNNTRRVAWGKSGRPQFVPVASLVVG